MTQPKLFPGTRLGELVLIGKVRVPDSAPSYKKKVDEENHEDKSVNASPIPVTIAAKTKVIKTLDSFKDHMLTHKQKLLINFY